MFQIKSIPSAKVDNIINKYSFERFASSYIVDINNLSDFLGTNIYQQRPHRNVIAFVMKYFYNEECRCRAFLNILTYIKIKNYLVKNDIRRDLYPKYNEIRDREDVIKFLKFYR